MRTCGECTLCCRLVPVHDGVLVNGVRVGGSISKPAGQRCRHQRHTGCNIYATRPECCQFWSCLWIANPAATADLSRPDRSHYLIDMIQDEVEVVDEATGGRRKMGTMQVWCDPKYPEAWREPGLLALIERLGAVGCVTLIRYNETDGIAVLARSLTGHTELVVKQANDLPLR